MKEKTLGDSSSFVVVFDTGDEFPVVLENAAESRGIGAATFTGIGSFSEAVLAYFDVSSKQYKEISVPEQVEIVSLIGNVSRYEAGIRIHAHALLGRPDGSTIGGHLVEAKVRPTLELFVTEYADSLERTRDEESGLPLIDFR